MRQTPVYVHVHQKYFSSSLFSIKEKEHEKKKKMK